MDNNQNENQNFDQTSGGFMFGDNPPTDNNVQAPLEPTVDTVEQANETPQKTDGEPRSRLIPEATSQTQINVAAYNVEEKQKEKVQKEFVEDPHASRKRFFGFFLLVLIIGFALFLPDITMKIDEYLKKKDEQNITSGYLRCKMTRNTDTLKVDYSQVFYFVNKRIKTYTYEELSTGTREDSKELDALDKKCRNLDLSLNGQEGITITCNITSTTSKVEQKFDLELIDRNRDQFMTAFSEAGGQFPEFSAGEAIENVETKVNRAGYKCEKMK